jgi:hypothetical protein
MVLFSNLKRNIFVDAGSPSKQRHHDSRIGVAVRVRSASCDIDLDSALIHYLHGCNDDGAHGLRTMRRATSSVAGCNRAAIPSTLSGMAAHPSAPGGQSTCNLGR